MTNNSWDQGRIKLRSLLKELRKDRAGLTQAGLSQLLGKPQSYVSKYENGERRLDYVEVLKVCEALNISIDELNKMYEAR